MVHARAPRRASGRRRRALGLPPGAGSGGAARAKHPPLPGSPSGDKENKDGGMSSSWAGQLWKQYDPINKIIFPGVGSKPTYNERGTELRNEAPKLRGRRRPRSRRVERVASSRPETTDSTQYGVRLFPLFFADSKRICERSHARHPRHVSCVTRRA